jgi:hypothetical protein
LFPAARPRQGEALARTLAPDVVMERYYNFGGEGVLRGGAAAAALAARGQLAGRRSSRLAEGRLDAALLLAPDCGGTASAWWPRPAA